MAAAAPVSREQCACMAVWGCDHAWWRLPPDVLRHWLWAPLHCPTCLQHA